MAWLPVVWVVTVLLLPLILGVTTTSSTASSINSTTCDPRGNYFYYSQEGVCLWHSADSEDWFGAKHKCRQQQGDLLTVQTAAKESFIRKHIIDKFKWSWLDLTYNPSTTNWEWNRTQHLTFTKWDTAYGEPSGISLNRTCAAYKFLVKWRTENCGTVGSGYVCEADVCKMRGENGRCDQICNVGLIGSICKCFPGYRRVGKGRCVRIDMCRVKNGGCDQICVGVNGTKAECYCYPGYVRTRTACVVFDPCNHDNGKCQHKCVSDNGTRMHCLCNEPLHLANDGISCVKPSRVVEYVLYSVGVLLASVFVMLVLVWRMVRRRRALSKLASVQTEVKPSHVPYQLPKVGEDEGTSVAEHSDVTMLAVQSPHGPIQRAKSTYLI